MMTKQTTNLEPSPDAPRRCWPRRLALALGALALVYFLGYRVLVPMGVDRWMQYRLPADAPRIAFSPNDTWLEELGANEAYKISLTRAGGRLVEIQHGDTGANPQRIAAWLEQNKIDGVLLAGGGDVDPHLYGGDPSQASSVNRARDDFEIALIQVAEKKRLPILGICRGCQILNVAHSGTLQKLKGDRHFDVSGHPADLAGGSRLSQIMDTTHLSRVGSYHRQAARELGHNLRVSATGPDGVIEAIEGTGPAWVVAVQWHPELEVGDPKQEALLRAFVRAAK